MEGRGGRVYWAIFLRTNQTIILFLVSLSEACVDSINKNNLNMDTAWSRDHESERKVRFENKTAHN
jgi:hypothetical protein